jgi:hypothetical protein
LSYIRFVIVAFGEKRRACAFGEGAKANRCRSCQKPSVFEEAQAANGEKPKVVLPLFLYPKDRGKLKEKH